MRAPVHDVAAPPAYIIRPSSTFRLPPPTHLLDRRAMGLLRVPASPAAASSPSPTASSFAASASGSPRARQSHSWAAHPAAGPNDVTSITPAWPASHSLDARGPSSAHPSRPSLAAYPSASTSTSYSTVDGHVYTAASGLVASPKPYQIRVSQLPARPALSSDGSAESMSSGVSRFSGLSMNSGATGEMDYTNAHTRCTVSSMTNSSTSHIHVDGSMFPAPMCGPSMDAVPDRHAFHPTYPMEPGTHRSYPRSPVAPKAVPPQSHSLTGIAAGEPATLTAAGHKRKYLCNWAGCGKGFTTSGHLARHHRIHTGEKRYECLLPGCGSRFSRQDNMLQHYRTHMSGKSRRLAVLGPPCDSMGQPIPTSSPPCVRFEHVSYPAPWSAQSIHTSIGPAGKFRRRSTITTAAPSHDDITMAGVSRWDTKDSHDMQSSAHVTHDMMPIATSLPSTSSSMTTKAVDWTSSNSGSSATRPPPLTLSHGGPCSMNAVPATAIPIMTSDYRTSSNSYPPMLSALSTGFSASLADARWTVDTVPTLATFNGVGGVVGAVPHMTASPVSSSHSYSQHPQNTSWSMHEQAPGPRLDHSLPHHHGRSLSLQENPHCPETNRISDARTARLHSPALSHTSVDSTSPVRFDFDSAPGPYQKSNEARAEEDWPADKVGDDEQGLRYATDQVTAIGLNDRKLNHAIQCTSVYSTAGNSNAMAMDCDDGVDGIHPSTLISTSPKVPLSASDPNPTPTPSIATGNPDGIDEPTTTLVYSQTDSTHASSHSNHSSSSSASAAAAQHQQTGSMALAEYRAALAGHHSQVVAQAQDITRTIPEVVKNKTFIVKLDGIIKPFNPASHEGNDSSFFNHFSVIKTVSDK